MLKNYLKIAFRNIRKQKLYSFINIFGLSVGIACAVLVYLFVQDELSFDRFHEDGERIFRMERVIYESDQASRQQPSMFDTGSMEGVSQTAYLPLPLATTLQNNYPEVEQVVRYDESDALLRNGQTVFEEPVNYVEDTFFEMFSFRLLKGNPKTVLEDKRNIVLTPAVARKYFAKAIRSDSRYMSRSATRKSCIRLPGLPKLHRTIPASSTECCYRFQTNRFTTSILSDGEVLIQPIL